MNRLRLFAIICLLFASFHALAQKDLEQGIKGLGSYSGGDFDQVSITNGNLFIHIPLVSYPQRGGKLRFSFALQTNSKANWVIKTTGNPPYSYWGWNGGTALDVVREQTLTPSIIQQRVCGFDGDPYTCVTLKYLSAVSSDGSSHHLHARSTDLTGITSNGTVVSGKFIDNEGIRYSGPGIPSSEDPNGNKITYSSSPAGWTDTLGRFVPTLATTTNLSGCPTGTLTAKSWNVPSYNGGSATFKFCYKNFNLSTDFQIGGVHESAPTVSLMNAVVLPDGTKWQFSYDSYGSVSSITLPTGGTISYTWGTLGSNNVSASRTVLTRTVNANDGSQAGTWTYTRTTDGSGLIIVTDPTQNDTEYRIWGGGSSGTLAHGWYTDRVRYFQGSYLSGTLLKTILTTYEGGEYDCDNDYATGQSTEYPYPPTSVRPVAVATTLQYGTTTKAETDWDHTTVQCIDPLSGQPDGRTMSESNGSALEQREYAYGSGGPGGLVRKTIKTYLWQSDSAALTNNLLALAFTVEVQDGSGQRYAETEHYYDQTAVVTTPAVTTQHNNPPTATKRGNETTTKRWVRDTTFATSTATYFYTGMVQTASDPGGHSTTYAYSSTFKGAYPTQVSLPNTTNDQGTVTHSTSANYDFNTGLLTSSTDDNGNSTTFSYDTSFRLTQKNFPNGGQTTWAYTSASPFKVTVTSKITSTMSSTQEAEIDNLGRVAHTRLTSDPEGTVYTDTTYDNMGRVSTVTNPYRSTEETSFGVTTTKYDALSRVIKTIPADGSDTADNVTSVFTDNCVTVTDQAGKRRMSCTDAQGRLAQVFEPNANGSLVNETDYQYNPLDSLIRVDQKGNDADSGHWRTRTFVYDGLSRLVQSYNPEAGKICYGDWNQGQTQCNGLGYDDDGNVIKKTAPQPNAAAGSTATISISYTYDQLHRLTGKSSSNGQTGATYLYDETSFSDLGLTITNGKGHRTAMVDASGETAWSYNEIGGVLTEKQKIGSLAPKTTGSSYNLDGSASSVTYPSGRTITYTYSSASRALSAVDTGNSINYATAATYSPWGALTGMQNGSAIVTVNTYNNRLQPIKLSAGTNAPDRNNVISFVYDFSWGAANNGDVYGVTNNRDVGRSVTYTYDELNRITSAMSQATDGPNCWGQLFGHLESGNYVSGYDAWGNLKEITVSQCTAQPLNLSIDPATNRVTNPGYSYDAAGNVTDDGTNSYYYDAENRVCSVGGTDCSTGTTYIYDGDGERVAKSSGTLYWGSLAESDLSGTILREYIFFGGKRVARVDGTGANPPVHYFFSDYLGSSTVVTNAGGMAIEEESDFYPFGTEHTVTHTLSDQNYKYMGKERDLETGLDFFGARYYNSSSGRWLSPDWSNSPTAVPYATLINPQTLNLYAFVANNPASNVELDGHTWAWLRHESEGVVPIINQFNLSVALAAAGDPITTETQEASVTTAFMITTTYADGHSESTTITTTTTAQGSTTTTSTTTGTTAPPNSRIDVVLYARDWTPTPVRETMWFYEMDWYVGTCTSSGCRQSAADQKRWISLLEQKGNGPWKKEGDPSQGVARDHFSPEPRTWRQRWFVDGKQVQLIVGKDKAGNLIKAWELHWQVKEMGKFELVP